MADPPDDEGVDALYEEERTHGEQAFQEHEQNLARFDQILQRIECEVRPGRFLDVGCSIGTSLVAARKRGWEVQGIELSRPVAEWGHENLDLDIRSVHLADAGFEEGSFDAILMNHVLEHVADPAGVLETCHRLLRPGGAIYQSLPNHGSLKGRLFGASWTYGVVTQHLSLFHKRSLRRMLTRLGYLVRRSWTDSNSKDPHLIVSLMGRLGRMDKLAAWCGTPGQECLDETAYVRFITDRRWAHFVSQRVWPARFCRWTGLGEDLHMLAVKEG
jgi:2-polyprenyl-3-methyl-5-hydroxy-6-metoxy-1,4-benzoquinol methylase